MSNKVYKYKLRISQRLVYGFACKEKNKRF